VELSRYEDADSFSVDGGEGKYLFMGTFEGGCVIVLCGDRGDTFVLLDGAGREGGKSVGVARRAGESEGG